MPVRKHENRNMEVVVGSECDRRRFLVAGLAITAAVVAGVSVGAPAEKAGCAS